MMVNLLINICNGTNKDTTLSVTATEVMNCHPVVRRLHAWGQGSDFKGVQIYVKKSMWCIILRRL